MIEEWRLYYGHVKFWKQVPVLRLLLEYIYKKEWKKLLEWETLTCQINLFSMMKIQIKSRLLSLKRGKFDLLFQFVGFFANLCSWCLQNIICHNKFYIDYVVNASFIFL